MLKKYLLLFGLFFCYFSSKGQVATIQELKKKLQTAQHDSTRFNILVDLSNQYIQTSLDTSWLYIQQASLFANRLPNSVTTIKYYMRLGNCYLYKTNFQKALENYTTSRLIAIKLNNRYYDIGNQLNKINIYMNTGQAVKAVQELQYIENNFTFDPKSADSTFIFNIKEKLCRNYLALGDLKRTSIHLNSMRKILKTSSDSLNYNLYLIGLLEEKENGITPQIYEIYQRSIVRCQQIKDRVMEILIDRALMVGYIKQNQYSLAIKFGDKILTKSLSYASQKNHYYFIVAEKVGEAWMKKGNYKIALTYFEPCLEYYSKNGRIVSVIELLNYISQCHAGLKNHQLSYQYLEKSVKLKEENYGENQRIQLAEIEADEKVQQKQKEISAKETENKIQQSLLEAEQKQNKKLLGLFCLSIVLLGVVIYNYYRKNKLSLALITEKGIVQQQADALQILNQTKDRLFSVLGHDLRSPVAELKDVLYIWRNQSIDFAEKQSLLDSVYQRVNNLQIVLDNLLEWSLVQMNRTFHKSQLIDLDIISKNVIEQLQYSAKQKGVNLITKLSPTSIYADEQKTTIIIRNILNNAIKFTPSGGAVKIENTVTDGKVILTVHDTGVGMSPEQLDCLFKQPTPQTGTMGEKGVGLGLEVCNELMQSQNGKILIESQEGRGTTVKLFFEEIVHLLSVESV